MRCRRIAIDMDEVIADALSEHLERASRVLGRPLTIDHVRGRPIELAVPPSAKHAVINLLDASFFENLAVMPDAQEVVRELTSVHEVFIATAAMDVPCSFEAKFRWLQEHFPFIAPSHIVFCGDKSVLHVDDLIDDSPRHFERFRGRGILFSAPHNCHETRYVRVDSWQDVRRLYFGNQPRHRLAMMETSDGGSPSAFA
jgi:5'(3')-deoxyribonucleotidase